MINSFIFFFYANGPKAWIMHLINGDGTMKFK